MTILTKPSSEKKSDKLDVPLVDNDHLASAPPEGGDPEAQTQIFVLRRIKRVNTTITICMLLTALLVVSIGIFSGFYLYKRYVHAQVQRYKEFKGRANIPYDQPRTMLLQNDDGELQALKDLQNMMDFFQEEYELDTQDEEYEKITVPDFRGGRSGRFVHDFNMNITGIIDISGKRCFVMPLDREKVLPPRTFFDLMNKMWDGYYKVDTKVVREQMRVITPPIRDTEDEVGLYISQECKGRPIYKLEKYVGGVVKRSAELHEDAKYAEFAGKGIMEVDIVNIEDAHRYEQEYLSR